MTSAGRTARFIFLLSCPFLFTGCATGFTHRVSLPSAFETGESLYLEKVPAVAQKAYQCGPAALESVVRYWGGTADAVSIGQALYSPRTRGVFNFSLAQYARTLGFWTEIHEEPGAESLKGRLRKGVPPIVMLDSGTLWVRTYHFVVLKGFDDRQKIFYANTGVAETQAVDYAEFERRWKKAGYWTLIAVPAGKVDWELDDAQSVDLALIFEKNGDDSRAAGRLESVLAKNPENSAAMFNLANLYGRTGRHEEAKAIYRRLLAKNPDRSEISNNLAWMYYEEGLYGDASETIEKAFKNGAPRTYDILDTAGMIACKSGRPEEAKRFFEEAEGRVPAGNAEALRIIAEHRAGCS